MNTIVKKRILVVDNDPASTRMVRLTLERNGAFEILELNNPTQAVSTARQFRPDLLLLDVEMPEMDGGDVARRMRATKELQTLPIVFMTSLVTEEEAATRIFSNGSRVLAKPVTMAKLMQCVVEQLNVLCGDRPATPTAAAAR